MASARSQLVDYALTTKYGYTGDERTILWTQDGITTRAEVELEHVENGTVEAFTIDGPPLMWTPQRAGHYVARVRACNDEGCSEWVTSQDYDWWLFFWLKPPEF